MEQYFTYVSTVAFFLLAMVWNRSDWVNAFIKITFTTLFFTGTFISLTNLGYIVKA